MIVHHRYQNNEILVLLRKVNSFLINILLHKEDYEKELKEFISFTAKQINVKFCVYVKFDERINFYSIDSSDIYFLNKKEFELTIENSVEILKEWFEIYFEPLSYRQDTTGLIDELKFFVSLNDLVIAPCKSNENIYGLMIVGRETDLTNDEFLKNQFLAESLGFIEEFKSKYEIKSQKENTAHHHEKMEIISNVSAGIAHDVNNVLATIFSSLDVLKKKIQLPNEALHLLGSIETSAIRARDLTRGMLTFGKEKATDMVNISSLINECANAFSNNIPDRIEFSYEIEENIPSLIGNNNQLYQVILNLLMNAKEAISGKGKIELSVYSIIVNDKVTRLNDFLEKGTYIVIKVSDTGCGMHRDVLKRIFEPYFSTKKKETASGIGLYNCYGIVKSHKGFFEIDTEVNIGSTFKVYLPSFDKPNKQEKKNNKNKVIMLVDDEPILVELTSELLQAQDYKIVSASSAEEAIEILKKGTEIDLFITDYKLSKMNGIECIKELRKMNYNFPVILATGTIHQKEIMNTREAGINEILKKPYDFDYLLRIVQKYI